MNRYYALYDKQLGSYRSGYVSTDKKLAVQQSADFVCEMSQSDEEPCSRDLPDQEILDLYDYEVREVKKEAVDLIIECGDSRVYVDEKLEMEE